MHKLIAYLFCQLLILQVSFSQDQVKEDARKTWEEHVIIKRQKKELEEELRRNISNIKKIENRNREQISILYAKQDEIVQKLKQKEIEYKNKVEEIRIKVEEIKSLKDSISLSKRENLELRNLVDSFSLALKELDAYNKKLQGENKKLGELLYFKVKDLKITEVENSYFSDFKLGYLKKGKPVFTQNMNDESIKLGGSKPFEYISVTGKVYTAKNIDTISGRILIYLDDVLWDNVRQSFKPSTRTSSYNMFDIILQGERFPKSVKTRKSLRVAFVTEEIFSKHQKQLEYFHDAYYSNPSLFIISSVKPDVNRLLMNFDYTDPPSNVNDKEVVREIDSCSSNTQEILMELSTNRSEYCAEFVSLTINNVLTDESIMLVPYNNPKLFSFKLKLKEGYNAIKVKALTTGISTCNVKNANLFILVYDSHSTRIFKKPMFLQENEAFVLYINYKSKGF